MSDQPASTVGQRISLSLISHTNAGKTTLARTLLQRDIGEVRDAPHVTEFAEDHVLLRSAAGDTLHLWDTPGFGDSVRLLERVRREGTALGWFLTAVWDRWRDRPFWASQQALRHVRDESDVVLYLVNASEDPQAAAYVDAEMELLAWLKRPLIVLLNQLGTDRSAEAEAHDIARWQHHLARYSQVRALLPLDAFSRCWLQEAVLWQSVSAALDGGAREAMGRLQAAWWQARSQVFEASAHALARSLADMALIRVEFEGETGVIDAVRNWIKRSTDDAAPSPAEAAAQQALMKRLDSRMAQDTAELLQLHGLEGDAQGEILQRVGQLVELHTRLNERQAAALGGVLTGALAGLKADIASGGLTLGGGMLAGGLLGALLGKGLARGVNSVRGSGSPSATLKPEALRALTEAALLRYLAVAHFGRGRGAWQAGDAHSAAAQWLEPVRAALLKQQARLDEAWSERDAPAEQLAQKLAPLVAAALREVLETLYPQAAAQWSP